MKTVSLAVLATLVALPAYAEFKGEVGLSVGQVDLELSGAAVGSANFDTMDFHSIVPVGDQFGIYLSHSTADGSIGGLGGSVSLDLKTTVVAVGYKAFDTMDYAASSGATGLIALGAMSSEFTASALGVSESISDDTGVVMGRLTGYLAPKVRGSVSFIADTDDFDPTFGVGVGYEVGAGVLGVGFSSKSDTAGDVSIKASGWSFGYTIEF